MITPNKKPPEIQTKTLRLDDFSMGLNTTISGSLLNNNELQIAEDVSFEQKGTIMPRRGRRKRYEEAFSDSPCCGLGSYYKKDGTTKLLFASGDKLYSDSPNMSFKWDNQDDWEEPNSEQFNLDSSTTPGDIQIKEATQTAPTPIFTRASVAYLEDGTEVASGVPRFEVGKFGRGVLIEEGTTNLADPAKQSPWTWTQRGYDWTCLTSLALTAGEVVTVSADVRNGVNGSRWFAVAGTGVTARTGTIDATKTRQTYTFTVTETATHNFYLVSHSSGYTFEYRNWQIEKKPYATSFVGGTRISESLKIPNTSLSVTQGTISLWAKNLSASANGSVLIDLLDNVGNQGMLCGIADDGKLFIEDAKLQFQVVETSQADFNTGTLSDVQATSAGNLELVRDGQDFSYAEASQSDFNSGTLTNVTATSEGNLELIYTPGETTYGTDFTGNGTYSADSEFNISYSASKAFDDNTATFWFSHANYPHWVKVDLGSGVTKTARKLRIYKSNYSEGYENYLKTFILQGSNDNSVWTNIYSDVAPQSTGWFEFTFSNSTAYRYYRIYGINSYSDPYMSIAEIELMEAMETQGTYAIFGTRVKEVDISGAVATGGTKIEWSKTTPTGTTVTVETALSLDGGSTYGEWQEATNGGSIPGITAQTDLSNARLKIRQTLTTSDTSKTPQLHSLSLNFYASYKSSGYRYKEYDISAVGSVGSSKITWTENTPASTTLTVKAAVSTDGGSTYGSFQTCTSGQAIPGLTQGMDVSNARLKVQVDLATSDGTESPQLQNLIIDVGSNVQTAYGPNKSTLTAWDLISLTWKSGRLSLVVNDSEACYIENPELPTEFGSYLFIGTDRNGNNAINTIVDELRIDNIARTDAEIADWYNANKPLIPDEYTTYLSHFDNSLSSEKLVPYAYWESAPKDVSQVSNKASGKAIITQTLNSGKVALYSASSPTSNGTYSDWALALPDGTLQHPPDNFVKIKLKLIDTYPYTVLLMHMDGSDNGTTFTDECGKTVTVHGDVVTKTGISKFGTASAYFNNNGEYLSIEYSEDFNFGSSDFTIDFWIYPTLDITDTNIFSNYYTENNYSLSIWGNKFYCSSNGSTWDICNAASLGTIPLNEWTHIAIVRYGTSLKVYVDGTAVVSVTTTASIHNSTEPIFIGGKADDEFTFTMTGYIDEFRISKGIARWMSNFTPPTSPYVLNSGPVVHDLTVTFDGEPSATPILDDMYFGAEYMFTTLKDILIIANGQNAPYKWDGVGTPTLLGGNPPVLDFITTHNNRVWGVDAANKSRVRFSDILDPETWSVLNFIDFNPDDGDYITAMIRIGQDLVVSKQWSMALLTGNATTNYSVVWLDVEQGVTGKRALCNTNKYFTYVAQDGIRFTDFNSHAVVSERLLPNWEKINKRRLNQAAMVYWRNYLLVALPMDNSLYNNTVWAYDMLRNAWSIINGWNVSNWLIFKQYGEEVLLAADSTTGQIYEVMRYSRYDDTEPVTYNIRTKDFTFDAPERYKLFRNINLDLEATAVESPLTVDLIVDGEKVGEYNTIIPANDRAKVHRMILPPLYNAVIGRSLSLALRGRCGIQGISLTYSFGGIVPDEEVVG